MNCTKFQDRVLEVLQGQPPAGAVTATLGALPPDVAEHAAHCANCRRFVVVQLRLEARLAAELQAPPLSASFDQKLWRRIDALPVALSADEIARKRARFEAEYAAELRADRRRAWREVCRAGPGLSLAVIAFVLALTLGNLAYEHAGIVRVVFGPWAGTALVAAALASAAAGIAITAGWFTRLALRVPVLGDLPS